MPLIGVNRSWGDGDKETMKNEYSGEDRISSLSDELIHHILSFSDVQLAVRTSVLSKRWKLIWTTLPFLNFLRYNHKSDFCSHWRCPDNKFFDEFVSGRNHEADVLKLNLSFCSSPPPSLIEKFVRFAITRNVQDLQVREGSSLYDDVQYYCYDFIRLSSFSSTTIKKLSLRLKFSEIMESNWDLPALTDLCLRHEDVRWRCYYLPISFLTRLPLLQTLCLDRIELPTTISLLALRTLYLRDCSLPMVVWDLPALLNLTLDSIEFPEYFPQRTGKFFSALVNLENLTLSNYRGVMLDCVIDCPCLVNLTINASMYICVGSPGKIIVSSTKICNFSCVGFFPIRFGVSELENVNMVLRDDGYRSYAPSDGMKVYKEKELRVVTDMFCGLGRAKVLKLDLKAIEALSAISDFLVSSPSPFYNLKFVKVPQGYKESSISTDLKCYLLGHSPNATIVTALPEDELIMQKLPVCLTSQNLFASPVAGPDDDLASSSRDPNDLVLWQGYVVNSEFVNLLDCIAKKYPETFYYFVTNSMKLCSMKLNILCTTVKTFVETSLTEVDTEMIAEYRALFADLQRSFNLIWLVNHLNSIELNLSQPLLGKFHAVESCIDAANGILQSQQANQTKMTTEIHRDTGTTGTTHAVGYIGDDLFSGP